MFYKRKATASFLKKQPCPNARGDRGASLIELLLAVSLFAIMLPALMTGFVASTQGRAQQTQRYQATLLMSEAEEAVRSISEQGWEAVETNGVYYPQMVDGSWQLIAGTETIDGYQRQVLISNVYRDSSGQVVSSGGEEDPSTKQVDVSVSWSQPLPAQAQTTFFLTRFRENISITHTTDEDFNLPGSNFNATELDLLTSEGDVRLSAIGGVGRSDWCVPDLVETVNLPGLGIVEGITAIPFEAFISTGISIFSEPLTYMNMTDENPPVATIEGTFDGYDWANDVFIDEDNIYLATYSWFSELVILDKTTLNEVGSYNASGWNGGRSIYVVDDVGYLAAGSRLFTVNLTSKTGGRPGYGSVNLAGRADDVVVAGDYAYVAINSGSNQLQIVDISSNNNPTVVASLTVPGNDGRDLDLSTDENTVYLVTEESSSQSELFFIDVSNKNNPSLVSTYDTNGMNPRAVVAVSANNRVLLVGTGGEEYQVVSTINPDNPIRCGGLDVNEGLYGIDAVEEPDEDAYAYITTGNTTGEFVVIEGGPGDRVFSIGEFESGYIDADRNSAFNSFQAVDQQPENSSVQYQVAVADSVGGDCDAANYVFIGPDGSEETFFTSFPAIIPFDNDGVGYENPGECFKYKVYLSSDDEITTPVFEELQVNFSP